MCTVLLPPGDNPIAVNKYIISYNKSILGYIQIGSGPHSVSYSVSKGCEAAGT